MDTLIQPSPRVAFVLLPDGTLRALEDITGVFTVLDTPICIRRISPLVRDISCGGQTLTIVEGVFDDIGSSIWLSSLAMCAWLTTKGKAVLTGKTVLELGAGIALGGVAAATVCAPARLLVTDGTASNVELARHNLAKNRAVGKAEVLVWGKDRVGKWDVILACDCIYRLNAGDFLAAVLQHLKPGGRLLLVNPPESSRAGIDDFIYQLWEHGEVTLSELPVCYEGVFTKQLLFVDFKRDA